MATFYLMQAANLFCGDHDPTLSKHLTLAELQLPTLQAIYADHHAGGARVGIELEVGVEKLEPTFKLNGWDPDLLTMFGLGSRVSQKFTAYGAILDKKTGVHIEAKAVMTGRLGQIAPDAFQQGELQGHEYAINEVTAYELWFNGRPKIEWNFFTSTWKIDGADQNADINRILRIT